MTLGDYPVDRSMANENLLRRPARMHAIDQNYSLRAKFDSLRDEVNWRS
jgi:hypothetical protein